MTTKKHNNKKKKTHIHNTQRHEIYKEAITYISNVVNRNSDFYLKQCDIYIYSIIYQLSFEVYVYAIYILHFVLVQVLSFDITVIRIYDKLANDNSEVGTI